ncbi:hypothetical protein MTR62_13805 [Novosphingobium sp. 1949]|uniref:Uncharacterized protein n=1 Tax=Novosphingobium organovorum TaxID=2930092 RepID=A0ABT0BFD6_9SPHN|nr:hypothetical protein [Novosphingobium organovorum]MCJ2183757.1 hypothetical protein [Novosphingobium organovorum]
MSALKWLLPIAGLGILAGFVASSDLRTFVKPWSDKPTLGTAVPSDSDDDGAFAQSSQDEDDFGQQPSPEELDENGPDQNGPGLYADGDGDGEGDGGADEANRPDRYAPGPGTAMRGSDSPGYAGLPEWLFHPDDGHDDQRSDARRDAPGNGYPAAATGQGYAPSAATPGPRAGNGGLAASSNGNRASNADQSDDAAQRARAAARDVLSAEHAAD